MSSSYLSIELCDSEHDISSRCLDTGFEHTVRLIYNRWLTQNNWSHDSLLRNAFHTHLLNHDFSEPSVMQPMKHIDPVSSLWAAAHHAQWSDSDLSWDKVECALDLVFGPREPSGQRTNLEETCHSDYDHYSPLSDLLQPQACVDPQWLNLTARDPPLTSGVPSGVYEVPSFSTTVAASPCPSSHESDSDYEPEQEPKKQLKTKPAQRSRGQSRKRVSRPALPKSHPQPRATTAPSERLKVSQYVGVPQHCIFGDCAAMFPYGTTWKTYLPHLVEAHPGRKGPVLCPFRCGQVCDKSGDMTRHFNVHLPIDLVCLICQEDDPLSEQNHFSRMDSLKRHIKRGHRSSDPLVIKMMKDLKGSRV